jgi:anthranilate phosphoribosyltransferase
MISFARYIKEVGRGARGARDLEPDDAYQLFGAMLDSGVPDLELGAALVALRVKGESLNEMIGFHQAIADRLYVLRAPDTALRPIVIPSYSGARAQPNLLPLLALLLARFNVPVLIHGTLHGYGRVATAYVLRELGILPSPNLAHAQQALDSGKVAFVPTAVLSPGLANLLALRERIGVRNSAHTMVKLIEPFETGSLRLVSVTHPDYLRRMREFLSATEADALLMRSTEGEAFANPKRRPQLEFFQHGECRVMFEAEVARSKDFSGAQPELDAPATAKWIRRVLAGEVAMPMPLVNQLACCLYASGYTHDLNQAKAIVAVETGSLAAA